MAPAATATRFQNEKGTNPEELIAAAHAGCFTMALAFQLQTAGFAPTSLSTEAAMSLIEVTRHERVPVRRAPGLGNAHASITLPEVEIGAPRGSTGSAIRRLGHLIAAFDC